MRNGDATVAPSGDGALREDRHAEDCHLKEEHGLARVVAWVRDGDAGRPADASRSAAAERMARCRARKAAAGIVRFDVPVQIADQVKLAGGWDAWLAQEREAAIRASQLIAPPDVPTDPEAVALGRWARQARGWRGILIRYLLNCG